MKIQYLVYITIVLLLVGLSPESVSAACGETIGAVRISCNYFPSMLPRGCIGQALDQSKIDERIVRTTIHDFLILFPQTLLEKYLTNIYLLGDLNCGGQDLLGSTSGSAIYIGSNSISDISLLRMMLWHEFAHILMMDETFPLQEWEAINDTPPAETFAPNSSEDFAEYSAWLAVMPERLCARANLQKLNLVVSFYRSLAVKLKNSCGL